MMPFKSVEDFFEECTTGVEFRYDGKWYLIEFDDPFTGLGVVRIHLQDEDSENYFDDKRCQEFPDLETLVHSYKIGDRTLAEIICDENGIPRNVLPVKRIPKAWQLNLFEEGRNGEKT